MKCIVKVLHSGCHISMQNLSQIRYILSAKYGLLEEDEVIEPYNVYLKDMNVAERRQWAKGVLAKLQEKADLKNDRFILLVSKPYYEYIIPALNNYALPLKGKTQGLWIPALKDLTKDHLDSKEGSKSESLHRISNNMKRLDWTMIDSLTFDNGIYVMFEKGESYKGMDRVAHIGTHKSQNRLKKRLRNHFCNENADSSIFRKNIGRAILSKSNDPYLDIWNLDTSKP